MFEQKAQTEIQAQTLVHINYQAEAADRQVPRSLHDHLSHQHEGQYVLVHAAQAQSSYPHVFEQKAQTEIQAQQAGIEQVH